MQYLIKRILNELTQDNWVYNIVSCTKEGIRCYPRDERAARWCVYGYAITIANFQQVGRLCKAYYERYHSRLIRDNDRLGLDQIKERLSNLLE